MPGVSVQERILATTAAAISSRAPRVDVAREIVEEIRRLIPFEAMHVSVVDPFSGGHATLINAGYSERVCAYIENEYTLRDPSFAVMVRDRVPLRMRDTQFDYRATYSYVNYWGPEGYGDGMTAPLHGVDGRYVGIASISTETEEPLTDEVREFMALLSGVLGIAVDPLADVHDWLDEHGDADRIVVRADGAVLRSAPEAVGAHAAVDVQAITAAAAALRASPLTARSGLIADDASRLLRVDLIKARSKRLSGEPVVLASLRPAGQPFGLTPRETVVLRHLVDGGSNREIADELGIAPRTIATHVEHLLHKLGVETRTGAAACALEHGLLRLDV